MLTLEIERANSFIPKKQNNELSYFIDISDTIQNDTDAHDEPPSIICNTQMSICGISIHLDGRGYGGGWRDNDGIVSPFGQNGYSITANTHSARCHVSNMLFQHS
jgi:hypothetical protein